MKNFILRVKIFHLALSGYSLKLIRPRNFVVRKNADKIHSQSYQERKEVMFL